MWAVAGVLGVCGAVLGLVLGCLALGVLLDTTRRRSWARVAGGLLATLCSHRALGTLAAWCGVAYLPGSLVAVAACALAYLVGLRIRLVGLTGGIAMGKSTVSTMLESLDGFVVVDADKVARDVVLPGRRAYTNLVKVVRIKRRRGNCAAFGREILQADGTLDRGKLRELVFQDPAKRRVLNSCTHSQILITMVWEAYCLRFASPWDPPVVLLDAPLLFETRLHYLCKQVVVVASDRTIQIQRLLQRDGKSRQDAERIIAAQMPIEEKVGLADLCIDNSSTLLALRTKVDAAVRQLRDVN